MTDTTIVLTDEYLEAAAELREAQADKKAAEEREHPDTRCTKRPQDPSHSRTHRSH